MNSNEIRRAWKKRRMNWTFCINSNGCLLQLCTIGIFKPIFLPSLHLNFFWFWNIPNHILKKYTIDAELAGHDMNWHELQNLCGSGFSLFAVHMLAKPYHLGVNWPITHCEIKDRVHFFTLNFECHNRYNKLLLCNSENSDIAWWNKNNSEWGFTAFFQKMNKILFLFKKQKKHVGCILSKK